MYEINSLKCNGMKNPIGIDDKNPRFSWKLASDTNIERKALSTIDFKSAKADLGCKNIIQLVYRIRVWDEMENLIWDSGEVKSAEVFDIVYMGKPLTSHGTFYWQVQSVNNKCQECISDKQFFTMGVLDKKEWKGKWIAADYPRKELKDSKESWKIFAGLFRAEEHPETILDAPVYMRKKITITKKVKKALAYATAHGIYELQIDGIGISDLLAPEYTSYAHYLEVQQYSITSLLTEGEHVLGIILADGWYSGKIGLMGIGQQYGTENAMFLQIELEYEDDTTETIVSDEHFSCSTGAYEYADLFVGERYNALLEPKGWNHSSYDDSSWKKVKTKEFGYENLAGRKAEPIRVIKNIQPKEILISPKGELIINLGENIAGVLSVSMDGKSGDIVTFTHSEVLDKEGNFCQNIMGQNKNQQDVYVFSKDGTIDYTPKFTFHGFQYVKVEGIRQENLRKVEGKVFATDLEITGSFKCSHEGLTKLQENIVRSQQGNMLSIPTDCPQRERAGWTGDMQVYAPTGCFNMDVESFLIKWLFNMKLEQLEDGQIPNVIPSMESDKYVRNSDSKHVCSAGWGDACVIIPYVLYQSYGKKSYLEEAYPMCRKWMDYVEEQAARGEKKYLWNTEFHFGDWLIPSIAGKGMENPMEAALKTKEYVATAMFAYTTGLMMEICSVLEKNEETIHYQEVNQHIKEAFATEYINESGQLPLPLQGLYVLALQMDLVPIDKKEKCIGELVALIHENGDCLDTGFLSVPFLLDTLYENGQEQLAYTLLYQKECPSWLYEVEMGATSIWESWNAILPDGTRTMASYNHFAFGCVGDFMYRKLLGIQKETPGYRQILIAPDYHCGLEWAQGSLNCPYGEIKVRWEKFEKEVIVHAVIPPNTCAKVKLPNQVVEVGSGTYEYRAAL